MVAWTEVISDGVRRKWSDSGYILKYSGENLLSEEKNTEKKSGLILTFGVNDGSATY